MAEIKITRFTTEEGTERYRVEADGQMVRPSASQADLPGIVDEIYGIEQRAKEAELIRAAQEACTEIEQTRELLRSADIMLERQRARWERQLRGHLISGKGCEDLPIEHVGYDDAQMGREK